MPPAPQHESPPPLRRTTPPPGARAASARAAQPGATSAAPGPARPSTRPPSRVSFPSLRFAAIDYDLANAARRVIESALGVVRGERVVLIVDKDRRDVGSALLEVARDLGADPIVHEIESHGDRPIRQLPEPIRAAMARAQASCLSIGFEDGEIGMRHELLVLVRTLSLRHAHMIGVSRRSLIAGFSVDHSRILSTTLAVRTRLRPDSLLRLRTPAGSDLEVRLDPTSRWTEHVGVIRPGKWENLPSGMLTTCPALVRGVFIADASIGSHFGQVAGLLDKTPLRLEIENSTCKSVRCSDRALQREVEAYLGREHNLSRVGGVSIGTNVGILAPTGELVADQNLPGLHIVFGSAVPEQTGASWSTRAQLPMTCALADVDLDGAPLLRAGRYMVT